MVCKLKRRNDILDQVLTCYDCAHFGVDCSIKTGESPISDCNDFEPTLHNTMDYIKQSRGGFTTVSTSAEDVSNETTAKVFLNHTPYTPAGDVSAITKPDMVNHPNHYTQGGIECIKAIEASMPPDGFQDYCKGNVIKYIWRKDYKNGLEDLKKARVYLNWMIESKENGHIE